MHTPLPNADDIRRFFYWSNLVDHNVLRPLDHIKANWEIMWDHDNKRYEPEEDSFAEDLNKLIEDIAMTSPPARYHDSEDRLVQYVIDRLGWPIKKEKGRWVVPNYQVILERGGFDDIDQAELLTAATGRVYAAIKHGQSHYDDMEQGHQDMLSAVLTIILYNRV